MRRFATLAVVTVLLGGCAGEAPKSCFEREDWTYVLGDSEVLYVGRVTRLDPRAWWDVEDRTLTGFLPDLFGREGTFHFEPVRRIRGTGKMLAGDIGYDAYRGGCSFNADVKVGDPVFAWVRKGIDYKAGASPVAEINNPAVRALATSP